MVFYLEKNDRLLKGYYNYENSSSRNGLRGYEYSDIVISTPSGDSSGCHSREGGEDKQAYITYTRRIHREVLCGKGTQPYRHS